MLLIFGTIAICIQACSKDDENKEEAPPKETPSGDGLLNSEQDTIIASQEFLSKV